MGLSGLLNSGAKSENKDNSQNSESINGPEQTTNKAPIENRQGSKEAPFDINKEIMSNPMKFLGQMGGGDLLGKLKLSDQDMKAINTPVFQDIQ